MGAAGLPAGRAVRRLPRAPGALGLLLTSLQVEAILVVALLLLGLRSTWLVFAELAGEPSAI